MSASDASVGFSVSDDLTVYSASDSGYSPTTDSKIPSSFRSNSTRNDFLLWAPSPIKHPSNQIMTYDENKYSEIIYAS